MTQFDLFATGPVRIDLPGADVTHFPAEIPPDETARLYGQLQHDVEWRQDNIRMYGREIPLPRLTAWFGDSGRDYTYSGIAMHALPWIEPVDELKRVAEACAGTVFNSVLCNLYRSGDDGLAWHSDDEPELGVEPIIASVNLGATRRFLLRRKDDHQVKAEVELGDGDVLVMRGSTQARCEHSVPKTKKPVGPRINLTFRWVE